MLQKRRRGDCSVVILLLLAMVAGGWFILQRRDHNRRTSPEFLNQIRKIAVTISEAKETHPDGKKQVYVQLKNDSDRVFEGKIVVYSREINGVILDRTTLNFISLPPGDSSMQTAWLLRSAIRPDYQYEIDGKFK